MKQRGVARNNEVKALKLGQCFFLEEIEKDTILINI